MLTFSEWKNKENNIVESKIKKFESFYELEAYTQGQHSPRTYKETIDFFDRLPTLPSFLKGFIPMEGKFDSLILKNNNEDLYRVDFDFVRKMMKVFHTDNDGSEDILYKTIPFTELIN